MHAMGHVAGSDYPRLPQHELCPELPLFTPRAVAPGVAAASDDPSFPET
jgi:hypothetical protein